jgi:hypothetical protein
MLNNIKAIMPTMGGDKLASTGLLYYVRDDTPMCHCGADEVSRSNLVEGNDITTFPRNKN